MRWRNFPGDHRCELCLNYSPVLHDLHWDDVDPHKGVWICPSCHATILMALQNYRHRLTVQDASRLEQICKTLSKENLDTTPFGFSLGKEDARLLTVVLDIVSIDGTVEFNRVHGMFTKLEQKFNSFFHESVYENAE